MTNWGIISLGRIAHKFAKDLQVVENARLHAVASTDLERSKEFAELYGAPHYYGSYEEMLTAPELHAVYIATPHVGHHANTILLLKRGIPVLCEKPFAVNLREAREMVKAARDNQTFLMEAMWTRFLPHLRKAVALVQDGTLGKVFSVKATLGFNAPFKPEGRLYNLELGGGALLDIGVYCAFLPLLLFGKPDIVKAVAHLGTTGVDEETGAVFLYDDGKVAHLHCSIRSNVTGDAFIYGEKGKIHLHTIWNKPSSLTLQLDGKEEENFIFQLEGQGFEYQIAEVMNCLRDGKKESDVMPLDFSLDLMETLDRIRGEAGIYYEQDEHVIVR